MAKKFLVFLLPRMSWFLLHSWSIFLLDIDFWIDKFSFLRYKWWHSSLQFLKVFLLLRNISETNIISFAGRVICSCTAGENPTEKQRWNIKQPQSEDWLEQGLRGSGKDYLELKWVHFLLWDWREDGKRYTQRLECFLSWFFPVCSLNATWILMYIFLYNRY